MNGVNWTPDQVDEFLRNATAEQLKAFKRLNPDMIPEAEIGQSAGNPTQPKKARSQEEAELIAAIIEAAHLYGWLVAHFRPARTAHGYRTAIQGDGRGFPDFVLVHPVKGLFLFIETKSEKGKLSLFQTVWRDAIREAIAKHWRSDCPVGYAIWRASDWPEIVRTLEEK